MNALRCCLWITLTWFGASIYYQYSFTPLLCVWLHLRARFLCMCCPAVCSCVFSNVYVACVCVHVCFSDACIPLSLVMMCRRSLCHVSFTSLHFLAFSCAFGMFYLLYERPLFIPAVFRLRWAWLDFRRLFRFVNKNKVFSYHHLSLRSTVGVWKNMFTILHRMSKYGCALGRINSPTHSIKTNP